SNSTSPRNTPVGSIWSSARSACSSASASAAASTTPKGSETRSQHGKSGGIKPEPASNGCSQPTRPAPNSAAPIQPPPKSQNHCDEPLVSRCNKRGIDLITIYPVSWRQRELKQSTLWLVFARPQPSAVFFDDGATDRKSHAHAAGLCREEWLEQLLEVVRAQAGTRVPHRDAHLFLSALGAD